MNSNLSRCLGGLLISLFALGNAWSQTAVRAVDGTSVEITVTPAAGGFAYAYEELVAEGVDVLNVSSGGAFDAGSSKIKWGPYFDTEARVFTYDLDLPADFSGVVPLEGLASFDGQDVTTSGALEALFGQDPGSGGDSESAIRELTLSGERVSVILRVTPTAGVFAYAVEETPPSGWMISDIGGGGTLDEASGKIKWGPYFDDSSRELSYTTTAPDGFAGVASFAGIGSFDGADSTIGGDSELTIEASPTSSIARAVEVDGAVLRVTLNTAPDSGVFAYAVEELLPEGFTVVESSDSGQVDVGLGKLKWGPFFDSSARELTYILESPPGFEGEVTLSGLGSFDGRDVLVTGTDAATIENGEGPGPGDPDPLPEMLAPTEYLSGEYVSGTIRLDRNSEGTQVVISWSRDSELAYQVETADFLGAVWEELDDGFVPRGEQSVSLEIGVGDRLSRFFRIRLIDRAAPEFNPVFPQLGESGVGPFEVIRIAIRDESDLDPASIKLRLPSGETIGLEDSRLNVVEGELQYSPADSLPHGEQGGSVAYQVSAADILGNQVNDFVWAFDL